MYDKPCKVHVLSFRFVCYRFVLDDVVLVLSQRSQCRPLYETTLVFTVGSVTTPR